ncbi:MAG: V-type ATP synthase subunit K [endosymbiont of Escarpia spicata]|uniref:V-type ATP synthase subunit K n=1 Tax=endosymbiont of Escarpia spicata TaxID=2200908 RepID=A0A370DBB8_9GAMM|nr:ATP synthase subunit C [gamma proteobacterium endosymbiont of Lamellibrachia anaximandri]MBL3600981.1 ATP synthase subunit C [gamma proteobacterium endosymbiont of Lamellibrachia anaximandri]MBL3618690.1 ATP synthase subunit C [gamma proteobacterium endosymbiont of Lamellibrachia anaximandri]RDH82173.1 MAG: V-type ATP synthase subunit K [endosymbiont of Escarpia spicata]
MNEFVMALGWVGIYGPMALGAIGSVIGCALAGQAAIGAMIETESGHGRYVGISAMPSSQVIYGIVVMFTLNRAVTPEAAAGMFGIGLLCGLALMFSAIYQGRSCAAAINAAKAKPEIFGLSLAPAAIVEGFAVFAFVFALVLSADLPGVK